MKHTTGPWLIDVANYHAGHIATVDHNGHVMEIWSETWPRSEDGPGNAQLIAAAPELLEALSELLAADLAMYPSAEAGKEAQDAWADRRAAARNNASSLIARLS